MDHVGSLLIVYIVQGVPSIPAHHEECLRKKRATDGSSEHQGVSLRRLVQWQKIVKVKDLFNITKMTLLTSLADDAGASFGLALDMINF
jgi:hypothetical protein